MRDDYVSLNVVPTLIPTRSNGNNVSLWTVRRWAKSGIRGIRLKTYKVGETRCTTRDDLLWFFQAIAEPRPVKQPPPHRLEKVKQRLAAMGF
jgi:hypothetical protein